MKFLAICAFVFAVVVKTQAGIITAGLGHGLARATLAAVPAATLAAAAPLSVAPAPVATATLTAAALPALTAFSGLHGYSAAGLAASPTITVGAPLAALATNVIGTRALLGGHVAAAPLVLPAFGAPLHGGLLGATLAGHGLPAHL